MNDRIHAYFDGELLASDLSEAELAQVRALEGQLSTVASTVARPPPIDIAARVMEQIRSAEAAPAAPEGDLLRRLKRWIWEPRPITWEWRPAYALGGALAIAALTLGIMAEDPAGTPPALTAETPAAPASPRLYVQFRLEAPGAQSVELAGSFTDWSPEYELVEGAPGVWSTLVPLDPGVHDYTFVIDGQEWVVDPYAPQIDDDFGGRNSRLFLPAPAIGA